MLDVDDCEKQPALEKPLAVTFFLRVRRRQLVTEMLPELVEAVTLRFRRRHSLERLLVGSKVEVWWSCQR